MNDMQPISAEDPLVSRDGLGRFEFLQPRRGYRFSIDSVLLAAFAGRARGPVVDLGAGCGVLCVLLASAGCRGPFLAVELDQLAARCCRENLAAAGLAGKAIQADLTQPHPDLGPGAFRLAVSNPPFFREGSGRLPPDPSRARARHELSLEAADLWERASRLLERGGRLVCCWPPARLVEALAGLEAARLAPKRLRLVHGRLERPARLALIEAVKDGGVQLNVEPPLAVYGRGRAYTPEVRAIYDALA